MAKDEHEELEMIARRAADSIRDTLGDDSNDWAAALRRYEPRSSKLPRQDLYMLLRTAEHALAPRHSELAGQLRSYRAIVDRRG